MSKLYEQIYPYIEKAMALKTAMVLLEWDNETLAPKEAGAFTTKMIGALSQEYFQCITNEEIKGLIEQAQKESGFTELEAGNIKEIAKEMEQIACIPAQEYREYAELTAKSGKIWAKAKGDQDFESFAPVLKEIIAYQKKFAAYQAKPGQKLYDVMLQHYEEGFDMAALDRFFGQLKIELVPLLEKIQKEGAKPDDTCLTGDFDAHKQEEICRFLVEYVGFDFNKGVMAVSAHPFTTNLHNHDVRITTHYDNHIGHSIFSAIHEAGHGIYELGIPDEFTQTFVGEGVSMGMHESQSRFFENILGRSRHFWKPIYKKLQEQFPQQLKSVELDAFLQAINKVIPGVIRIEADELTYSLHIMIRYELEKMLIEENLEVEQLPAMWADKYEEYLGVRPQHVGEGVLQDIHWSQGYFGYFPSYALGSAFGAQMLNQMKKEMNVEELIEKGEISAIRNYLKTHIHQFGKLKTSRELLKTMTGEEFNASYYISYLKDKYHAIYFQESR